MLVVFKEIERYKKAPQTSRALMIRHGRSFSHRDSRYTNRCIRDITIVVSIFFYLKYSKLIYQQLECTIVIEKISMVDFSQKIPSDYLETQLLLLKKDNTQRILFWLEANCSADKQMYRN